MHVHEPQPDLAPMADLSGALGLDAREGLLRADSAARASFYQLMLTNGVMTINEVRSLENLPPVEGGDEPRMQMQNVPITQAGQQQIQTTPGGPQ